MCFERLSVWSLYPIFIWTNGRISLQSRSQASLYFEALIDAIIWWLPYSSILYQVSCRLIYQRFPFSTKVTEDIVSTLNGIVLEHGSWAVCYFQIVRNVPQWDMFSPFYWKRPISEYWYNIVCEIKYQWLIDLYFPFYKEHNHSTKKITLCIRYRSALNMYTIS